MTVLLTSIGSASAFFAINTLSNLGIKVIGTDYNDGALLYCRNLVNIFIQVPSALSESEYIEAIIKICRQNTVDFIIPLTDPEVDLFSQNREIFSKISSTICTSEESSIKQVRDKYFLSKELESDAIIKVIPTYLASSIKNDFPFAFPWIAKPQKGRSSQDTFVYIVESDLPRDFFFKNDIVVQPFIAGEIIVADCIQCINDNIISVYRKELIRTSNGMGLSVMTFFDAKLTEIIERIFRKFPLKGAINIEFIKSGNDYLLMDINPRFSAGIAFSGLAGYNFVENHMRYFMNQPCFAHTGFTEKIMVTNYQRVIL